ncbi:hypothetical protein FOMG_18328 [Fusarium oxysporum f. sp. melonis 26406]|uniref:Uncharacterized protein n=1 Tax=Fusarium oxysporum f. sp. melonis 26406 TaxID=1089452 RepID=W9YZP2_FUSOX|nr:hypothetical protein FOMG_18328 [Fusarium oxysporum f. sp. melonis 26406]
MTPARSGNRILSISSFVDLVRTMKCFSLPSIRITTSFLSEIRAIATLFSKRPLRLKPPSLPHLRRRTDKEAPRPRWHIEP